MGWLCTVSTLHGNHVFPVLTDGLLCFWEAASPTWFLHCTFTVGQKYNCWVHTQGSFMPLAPMRVWCWSFQYCFTRRLEPMCASGTTRFVISRGDSVWLRCFLALTPNSALIYTSASLILILLLQYFQKSDFHLPIANLSVYSASKTSLVLPVKTLLRHFHLCVSTLWEEVSSSSIIALESA